ncbi:acyltransferase family protein [Pseudomonas citronellolis]|uniref:acyltransferase family protein n=1 Tax=Pseudomonas citronellolis TaxID=53408 RepID=UPI00078E4FAE|nr:acyltransferase [Pseudomonas citronellolis]AMO78196.1 Acyltransferase family protein [Pseudomonas citronellolis]
MLSSIQHLRGIAALLVLIHHAIHKQGQISGTDTSWDLGISGVDLFFIISGFIMCHITTARETYPRDFFLARIRRIIPLYWSLSLVALTIFTIKPEIVNSSGGTTSILNSFTLIPNGEKFLIQNGWTLSYEFLFYIIFATALWANYKFRLLLVSISITLLVIFGLTTLPQNPTIAFATSPILLEFLMGILAYLYITHAPKSNIINLALLASGLLFLIFNSTKVDGANRSFFYGIPLALIFSGVVCNERIFNRLERSKILKASKEIGNASYSIYLSHPFVIAATGIIIRKFNLEISPTLSILIMISTSIFMGYICHITLERKLSEIFSSKRQNPNSYKQPNKELTP